MIEQYLWVIPVALLMSANLTVFLFIAPAMGKVEVSPVVQGHLWKLADLNLVCALQSLQNVALGIISAAFAVTVIPRINPDWVVLIMLGGSFGLIVTVHSLGSLREAVEEIARNLRGQYHRYLYRGEDR